MLYYVKVFKLRTRPELNGLTGECTKYSSETQRYHVRMLKNDHFIAVKAENIVQVSEEWRLSLRRHGQKCTSFYIMKEFDGPGCIHGESPPNHTVFTNLGVPPTLEQVKGFWGGSVYAHILNKARVQTRFKKGCINWYLSAALQAGTFRAGLVFSDGTKISQRERLIAGGPHCCRDGRQQWWPTLLFPLPRDHYGECSWGFRTRGRILFVAIQRVGKPGRA